MHDHAFIIRCWDEADVPNANAINPKEQFTDPSPHLWRYRIIHANSGQYLAADTLSEITIFIAGVLDQDT